MKYLFEKILPQGTEKTHAFISDRCRSIKSDLNIQKYSGSEAFIIHEHIIRYQIMCTNLLCESECFVLQNEVEQIQKSLITLIQLYEKAQFEHLTNRSEFISYYLLLFPWDNDILSRLEIHQSDLLKDPMIEKAVKIKILMSTRLCQKPHPSVDGTLNNYSRIFHLLRDPSSPYLFSCCVHVNYQDIRDHAIHSIQRSLAYQYFEHNLTSGMSVKDMVEILGFDSIQQCLAFLKHYQIPIKDEKIIRLGRQILKDSDGILTKGPKPMFPFQTRVSKYPLQKCVWIEAKNDRGTQCIIKGTEGLNF
jgi:hypothetical protein